MTQKLKAYIGVGIFAQRVHVHANLLPLVKVAGSGIAGVLAAGAGHGVAAGAAVAHRTGLAVGTDAVSGGGQNLIVIHIKFSLIYKRIV
jgi:hypothetical protein